VIRQSGLPGPTVDRPGLGRSRQATLRHNCATQHLRVGDVAGVPKGKTASVKWQVPVVEDHLVAAIRGRGHRDLQRLHLLPADHPVGRAMLIEFDYNNNLTPSFPGIIAPLEELWISWLMKEVALKATYNAMLRGRPEETRHERPDLHTLIAVFEEIFGRGLFWAMVVAAVAITAAYLYVLVRDRSMSMRKFLLAQLSMPFGAIAAVLFVQLITNSGFSDIGGPIDLIVLLGVASLGAVGIAVLVYTLQSLMRSRAG
jgi:hypothetical protein